MDVPARLAARAAVEVASRHTRSSSMRRHRTPAGYGWWPPAGHRDSQLPSAKSTLTMSGSRTPERAHLRKAGPRPRLAALMRTLAAACAGRAPPRWS